MKTKNLTPEELGQEAMKLTDYKANLRSLYASFDNKRLYIDGNGNFIVAIRNEKEERFIQPYPAIKMLYES